MIIGVSVFISEWIQDFGTGVCVEGVGGPGKWSYPQSGAILELKTSRCCQARKSFQTFSHIKLRKCMYFVNVVMSRVLINHLSEHCF